MIRVRVNEWGGAQLGILPDAAEVRWYTRDGQGGALTIQYAEGARGFGILRNGGKPVELVVELDNGKGGWMEPRDARFRLSADDWERLEDGAKVHSFSCQPIAQWLAKALVDEVQPLNVDGERMFSQVSPGAVMSRLISDAKGRGWAPWFGVSSAPDATIVGRNYSPLTSLWEVLTGFHELGLLQWHMTGRMLVMAPASTYGTDRATGDAALYLRDMAIGAAPEKVNYDDLATSVLVRGEGKTWRREVSGGTSAWGRMEVGLSLGGITSDTAALRAADNLLAEQSQPKREYTREWSPQVFPVLPGRDVDRGDWVLIDTDSAPRQRMRVYDLSVSRDNNGEVKAFVTLGSVHDELVVRLARRQQATTGGTGVVSGGIPAPSTENRTPKTPTGLMLLPEVSLDSLGLEVGTITASWSAVTQATTGAELGDSQIAYRLRYRRNIAGAPYLTTGDMPELSAMLDKLSPGVDYAVSVQAVMVEAGRRSAWSPEVVAKVGRDSTPPPVPSKPILSSSFGAVTVSWDKLGSGGVAMPIDFHHIDVVQDGRTVGQLDATWPEAVIPGLAAGASVAVSLVAVDRSGNRSGASAPATITVRSVLDGTGYATDMAKIDQAVKDVGAASVDVSRLIAGPKPMDVAAATKMIADFGAFRLLTADKLVVTPGNLFPDPMLVHAAAWSTPEVKLRDGWMEITGDGTQHGAYYQPPGVADASMLLDPGTAYRISLTVRFGGTGGVTYLSVYLRYQIADGSTKATRVAKLMRDAGSSYQFGAVGQLFTTPAGMVGPCTIGFVLEAEHPDGSVTFSRVKVVRAADASLVVDGSISGRHIAVDTALANSVTARAGNFDTILTGELLTKILTGATMQTNVEAKKGIKIRPSGITAYGTSGTSMFALNAATGDVSAIGGTFTGSTFQSSVAANAGVKFSDAGIRGWDASGNQSIDINGEVNVLTGVFRTAPKGQPAAYLTPVKGDETAHGLWLSRTGSLTGDEGAIWACSSGTTLFNWLEVTTIGLRNDWDVTVVRSPSRSISETGTRGSILLQGEVGVSENLWVRGKGTLRGGLKILGGGRLELDIDRSIYRDDSHSRGIVLDCWPKFAFLPDTTGVANAYFDANGRLFRSTSARRFKANITDATAEVDPWRILDVQPRMWHDRGAMERGEPLVRIPGVIAEEVDAVGLHQWVTRDPDGTVTGVAYDRLCLLLIPVVRDLRERLDRLERTTP